MLWKWRRSESVRGDRDGSKLEWIRRIRMRLEYDNALQQIDIFLSQAEIDEVRIAILDYARKPCFHFFESLSVFILYISFFVFFIKFLFGDHIKNQLIPSAFLSQFPIDLRTF